MPAIEDLTTEWLNRVKESRRTHAAAMRRQLSLHFKTGLLAALLAALAGLMIFAGGDGHPGSWIRIPAALLSIAAAVLASLQTLLRFSEQAEKHRLAAADFDAVERSIELARAQSDKDHPIGAAQLEEFRAAMDGASKQAPKRLFDRFLKTVRQPLKRRKAAPKPGTLSIFGETSRGPS